MLKSLTGGGQVHIKSTSEVFESTVHLIQHVSLVKAWTSSLAVDLNSRLHYFSTPLACATLHHSPFYNAVRRENECSVCRIIVGDSWVDCPFNCGHGLRLEQKTTWLSCFKTGKAENQYRVWQQNRPQAPGRLVRPLSLSKEEKSFLYVAEVVQSAVTRQTDLFDHTGFEFHFSYTFRGYAMREKSLYKMCKTQRSSSLSTEKNCSARWM